MFCAMQTIALVYRRLVVSEKKLDDRFFIGEDAVCRNLSLLLGDPASDGWNVVMGAIELARIWGLCASTEFDAKKNALDFGTRMRLAVCLSVSWKFARANYTNFDCPFVDPNGHRHTLELAYISQAFMLACEVELYGIWPTNIESFTVLQVEQLDLELHLLLNRSIWSSLSENPQVLSELEIEELQKSGVLKAGEHAVLIHRSLVPFFVRVLFLPRRGLYLVHGNDAHHVASAVLCCVMLCLCTSPIARKTAMYHFDPAERELACEIIDAARDAAVDSNESLNESSTILWEGCYGDLSWPLYRFVSKPAILRLHSSTRDIIVSSTSS